MFLLYDENDPIIEHKKCTKPEDRVPRSQYTAAARGRGAYKVAPGPVDDGGGILYAPRSAACVPSCKNPRSRVDVVGAQVHHVRRAAHLGEILQVNMGPVEGQDLGCSSSRGELVLYPEARLDSAD